jgi:hypothetical protein
MKYRKLKDGDGWTVRNGERFKFACCDCGLVHNMVVYDPLSRKGKVIGMALERNRRATGQKRRHMK